MTHPIEVCRECRAIVELDDLSCEKCGAPRPGRKDFAGEGFEWRTRGEWMGAPWVHVAFGMDAKGKPRAARGVVAMGQRARGMVAIGIVATGGVAIGVVAIGFVSVGVVCVGLVAAGVNAFGLLAAGVVPIGVWAAGVSPLAWRTWR